MRDPRTPAQARRPAQARTPGEGSARPGFRNGTAYQVLEGRTYLWVNDSSGGEVFRRRLEAGSPRVYRFTNPAVGFAITVRCLSD